MTSNSTISMAGQTEGHSVLQASSMVMGWAYFLLWSVSFYPQVWKNWKQKSTQGLSPDFPLANTFGLLCYAVYASALLYSPIVQTQYADRHHGHKPAVNQIDFVYGAHAVCVEFIIVTQYFPKIWRFKEDAWQRPSWSMIGLCSACLAYLVGDIALTAYSDHPASPTKHSWAWLDVTYAFGNTKVILTVIKYAPQAHYFYKRKSTKGFAMSAVYMDLGGSVLSLAQLIVDAKNENDWSGITGNRAKLGLSQVGLAFSGVYLFQHHVLYREARKIEKAFEDQGDGTGIGEGEGEAGNGETQPLLRDEERQ